MAEEAYEQNTASTYPEPEDKEAFIRTHLYDYNYDKVSSSLRSLYPAEKNLSISNAVQFFVAWLGKLYFHS